MRIFNKKFYLIFAVLVSCAFTSLFGQEMTLSKALTKAKKGDFVVTSQNKTFTLFHIFDVNDLTLTIEEVSAPISFLKPIKSNWQKWINEQAPGHSSWVIYELDLNSNQIEDIYSYSQKSWQKIYPGDQIFPTLINLKFNPIHKSDRKKAGPKPPPEMIDDRPIWQPPIISYGKKLKGISSDAYQAYWPEDQSELAGKKIEIFLPKENDKTPSYFPCWIQVSNYFAQSKLRVVDSGFNLNSIHSHCPIPPPELISNQFNTKGDLEFVLKSHPHFKDFKVYAKCFDDDQPQKELLSEVFETSKGRKVKIVVSNTNLNNNLDKDKLYYFIFQPDNYSHMSIETTKPIGIVKKYAH